MSEFADRMKAFTDHLRDSIEARGEALAAVHDATTGLLDDARSFLGRVADEHRERSEELRATMESHREDRCRRVAEMRHDHQEALQAMRGELHQTLSEARRTRQDACEQMSETFRKARHDLAADLRSAAGAWRAFAASR